MEPVARRSTVEIVSDELRSAILYGSLEPGAQLGEAELAARLGVSRGRLGEGGTLSVFALGSSRR